MKKLDFNNDWYYKRLNESGTGRKVTVPHDAMCAERRSEQSRGQHNIGWFESFDYVYWKHFSVPAEYENVNWESWPFSPAVQPKIGRAHV